MENMIQFKCPACGGDGKETCHNPDHGYFGMIGGIVSANESACPCCGHDGEHKIRKYVDGKYIILNCYECSGTGRVDESECERILDEYSLDYSIDDFYIEY